LRLWGDPKTRHEIGKQRIPTGGVIFHPHQQAFHLVGQNGAGNAAQILNRRHETPQQARRIRAFDEADKAHP